MVSEWLRLCGGRSNLKASWLQPRTSISQIRGTSWVIFVCDICCTMLPGCSRFWWHRWKFARLAAQLFTAHHNTIGFLRDRVNPLGIAVVPVNFDEAMVLLLRGHVWRAPCEVIARACCSFNHRNTCVNMILG